MLLLWLAPSQILAMSLPEPPSSYQPPCHVVVARHGERLDYVSRDLETSSKNWLANSAKPYDPPLTQHGIEQGEKLGRHLSKELEQLGIPAISSVYTSPFLRCRQTSLSADESVGSKGSPPSKKILGSVSFFVGHDSMPSGTRRVRIIRVHQ